MFGLVLPGLCVKEQINAQTDRNFQPQQRGPLDPIWASRPGLKMANVINTFARNYACKQSCGFLRRYVFHNITPACLRTQAFYSIEVWVGSVGCWRRGPPCDILHSFFTHKSSINRQLRYCTSLENSFCQLIVLRTRTTGGEFY